MLTIYAPMISTYGRIVAMTAAEASLPWRIVPTEAASRENQMRHPFMKTPSVELNGLDLYESEAICQYIDDCCNASALQPEDPVQRARMTQWISIANQYLFPSTENGLVLPRLVVPLMGGAPREDLIEKALPTIAYQMTIVSNRLEESAHMAGPEVSLADIFMYCILRAVELTPEGDMIVSRLLPLRRWLRTIGVRKSAQETQWPAETEQPS